MHSWRTRDYEQPHVQRVSTLRVFMLRNVSASVSRAFGALTEHAEQKRPELTQPPPLAVAVYIGRAHVWLSYLSTKLNI